MRSNGVAFILALVLAWPTYGLTLVAWAIWRFVVGRAESSETAKVAVAPVVREVIGARYLDLFRSLKIPLMAEYTISDQAAEFCGRHIARYLEQNPEDGQLFLSGIADRTSNTDDNDFSEAGHYAGFEMPMEDEVSYGLGKIHLACYHAIEALMTNNPNLKCFNGVDYGKISLERLKLEYPGVLDSSQTKYR